MKSTAKYVIGLVALLCAGVAGNVHAQCPHQGLASFGPITPAGFGYPAYYVDQNGVGLKACQDPADPVCAAVLPPLPNPAAPLDIAAGNFFSEFPYTFINATVPMPGGGIGLLVYSVLGTFAPVGDVVPGTQVVFSRVRFRIDTPAAGTYTMTHPFGVTTLTAAAPGRRSINFTDDCLVRVPPTCGIGFNTFTTPLDPSSFISTWLRWDATPPAPPAGAIGDFVIPHPITGSPCGTTDFCTPPTVGCGHLNNALACNDGNAATVGDSCSGSKCMGFTRDAKLTLIAGENPSLSAAFPAAGDARTNGTSVRVSLINMDPSRFPAGCTGAAITVGGISGTATVTPFAAQAAPLVRATAVNFLVPGTVAAGSTAQIRLGCTVGGVTHSTRWSGVVANAPAPAPAPCTPTTCAAQGKNCGTIPDGCGGTLTCGVCTAPLTCGGGGVANVCGTGAPAPVTAALTLTATGRAGETVSSTPAGLSVRVGSTGSATFPVGTSIRLGVTNGRSVIWSGVCSSGGAKTPSCTFTLNAASSETANVQ